MKFMRKLIIYLTFALFALGAYAGNAQEEYASFNIHDMEAQVGENLTGKIHLQIAYPEGFALQFVYIFSKNQPYSRWYADPAPQISFSWWEGDECFFCLVGKLNGKKYVLISQDFEVTTNTEINLNFDDCVNTIEFIPILPNGEEGFPDIYDENYENICWEGNIQYATCQTLIARKGYSVVVETSQVAMYKIDLGFMQQTNFGGFRINNLDSDIEILGHQSFVTSKEGESYEIYHSINGKDLTGNVILRNGPNQYVNLQADYIQPPAGPYDIIDG